LGNCIISHTSYTYNSFDQRLATSYDVPTSAWKCLGSFSSSPGARDSYVILSILWAYLNLNDVNEGLIYPSYHTSGEQGDTRTSEPDAPLTWRNVSVLTGNSAITNQLNNQQVFRFDGTVYVWAKCNLKNLSSCKVTVQAQGFCLF